MICRKCSGPGTLIIRKEYCYCNDCFITNINHKFRACIGKNKILSPNEKVLICLSGDASSTVLLDLIHVGFSLNNHKKLRVTPYFLHIIERDSDGEEISKVIAEQCKNYNFNLTVVNMDEYFNKNILSNEFTMINHHQTSISKNILSNIPTSISEDMLTKMKQNIFIKISKQLKCRIVFTAETTTLLATRLLSNIAIGRGSQVENDIGFADKREENVIILRPMRDITNEEVDQYLRIKDLKPATNILATIHGTSLQSVIRSFVLDLQENYPATVSTICKTADKIGSITVNVDKKKCIICQSNLDCNQLNLTAVDATMFSRKVSSEVTNSNENLKHVEKGNNLMFPFIYEKLCYCCSRNISQLNDPMLQTLVCRNDEK
ncbi:cytoplasmic tRNA 2-thiolation protein 2 [Vanessa cardui]|uniref:cytoplasmic tRNA 2-thiolation protein 2 n=1 Tax=Vanessa cardui TaxID=171605 RepID=UPI001F14566F|nr:cytoplasmic tRNA 2-thiolation protein 2 [Vanessa cardui]